MPAIPSWLLEPLWDQFSALLPERPAYDPGHPLGCHRPRIADRLIFEKLLQVLRFGCSHASIADCTCGATTIRERRDEWIEAGILAKLKSITREAYDRIVGLVLEELIVDGCIAKAPGGGKIAGRSPVDRGKPGYKRSLLTEGKGHSPRPGPRPREPPRLPAPRPCPGQARRGRAAPGRRHRPPRRRLRLRQDPRRAGKPQPQRRNCAQGREGPDPGRAALARRAHQRLAQQLQPPPALLRARRASHRRLLRPRRRHHHPPSPHPRSLDPLPMGHPTSTTTIIDMLDTRPICAPSNPHATVTEITAAGPRQPPLENYLRLASNAHLRASSPGNELH